MPRYTVTYTTDTRPTDLPDGATFEEVSALPLSLQGNDTNGRNLYLDSSAHVDDAAFFAIEGRGVHLDRARTVQVRDALDELLGETAPEWDGHSEPPADVVVTRDRDGDHWYRARNGKWAAYEESEHGDDWDNPHGGHPAAYGPHTIVRRS